jgi:DNA-binding response OmpR family regulator
VTADPPAARVLVVEDDRSTRLLVRRVLERDGFHVVEAADGVSAMAAVTGSEGAPAVDLVILDLQLPRLNGLAVLRALRRESEVPVIILSGRGDEAVRVLGFEAGADDYVVKPFFPRELLARVRAVLRRVEPPSGTSDDDSRLVFGDLLIDRRGREVLVGGEAVAITAREFDLLAFLAASPREVFSREQLLNEVWRSSSEWQDPATVTELIRRLRLKVEPEPDRPRWIQTVRGVGYRFDP